MSIFCETSFCVYCVLFLEYNFALLVCNDVCVNMKGSQGMKGCLACTNNHIYTTLLLEYSSYQHHKYDCSNYYIYSNKFPPLHGSIGTHFAKFLISNFLRGLTYSAYVCIMYSMYSVIWFGLELGNRSNFHHFKGRNDQSHQHQEQNIQYFSHTQEWPAREKWYFPDSQRTPKSAWFQGYARAPGKRG